MNRFAASILHHRALILSIFTIALVLSAFLALKVPINYDLTAYVPDHAPSTRAIREVDKQFGDLLPNLTLVVEDVEIADALQIKKMLSEDPEIVSVQWLDDVADMATPIEMMNAETRDYFYKDHNARFVIALKTSDYVKSLDRLRASVNHKCAMSGQAVDLARAGRSTGEEINKILLFAVPAALLILFWVTSSWFEPILFMITVFSAVLLNLGTNYFLGEISFLTQSVSAVLQLAVSMDYAIFLLNRFSWYREKGLDIETAMQKAIVKAFSSVTSSALTTFFGFISLIFMQFKIGPDMGVVLAKGIVFSLISVLFLLPSLTLLTYKIVDKCTHRSFLPPKRFFMGLGKLSQRLGPLMVLIVLVTVVPLYKARTANHFLYGMGSYPAESIEAKDRAVIRKIFGESQQAILLVPAGDPAKEAALIGKLEAEPYVEQVMSYANAVGYQIPEIMVPPAQLEQLKNDQYTRFIVNLALPEESPLTFKAARELRDITHTFYEGKELWAGAPFALYDMRQTIQSDDVIVNGLAILSVALVLLFTFRSLSLPFILVFTIEYAIWCNLSVSYFTGSSLNYIGYLVISTIQLGATVDYAILETQYYRDRREEGMKPKEASWEAVAAAVPAIMPPALILSAVGFVLAAISTIPVVSEIGQVLGRGALFSLFTVVFLLPTLLRLFDKIVTYTSLPRSFSFRASNKASEDGVKEKEA